MVKEKWFKAKRYGWGWTPATWQGWGVLVLYTVMLIFLLTSIDRHSHSVSDTLIYFLPNVFILSALLVTICFFTGEKPEWRWGEKKAKKSKRH